MEQTGKNTGRTLNNTHSFPTIESASDASGFSGERFRPMFQSNPNGTHSRPGTPCDPGGNGNGDDPLAAALKESYERGVEAGNKEACELAQKELDPSLDRFLTGLNAFSDSVRHLTLDYAGHIIMLAQAIVGKIVKDKSRLTADDMVEVQQDLEAMLRRHLQLHLQINSDDLKDLADAMRCRNIELSDTSAIQICDNGTVQRGAPQYSNSEAPFEELLERTIKTLEAMPSEKVSTS